MVSSKATNRYPRPGERVAPYTLREFLMEPIPGELKEKLGGMDIKLCDLDETIWSRFPAAAIYRACPGGGRSDFGLPYPQGLSTPPFSPPARGDRSVRLEAGESHPPLPEREGFDEHPETLGDHTIGEICRCGRLVRAAWWICSARWNRRGSDGGVDGAGGVGSRPACGGGVDGRGGRRWPSCPARSWVCSDDPRFARQMRADGHRGPHGAGAGRAAPDRGRRTRPIRPTWPARCSNSPSGSRSMPRLTLEEELIEIFVSAPRDRNAEILIGYYGWNDGRQHTLTRHRQPLWHYPRADPPDLRQADAEGQEHRPAILAPVMDRVAGAGPAAIAGRGRRRGGGTRASAAGPPSACRLESLATGARLLGRRTDFRVVRDRTRAEEQPPAGGPRRPGRGRAGHRRRGEEGRLFSRPGDRRADRAAGGGEVPRLRRPGTGAANLAVGRRVLPGWTRRSGWFRIEGIGKHGLPKTIDKVLAVAGSGDRRATPHRHGPQPPAVERAAARKACCWSSAASCPA